MDEHGNIVILIVLALAVVLIVPPLAMMVWPPVKILFQIISLFIIYSLVRGYLGSGVLTVVVSAVLIYFLVFKYTYIFASLYIFQILMGLSFTSVVIWGVGTQASRLMGPK